MHVCFSLTERSGDKSPSQVESDITSTQPTMPFLESPGKGSRTVHKGGVDKAREENSERKRVVTVGGFRFAGVAEV